LLYWLDRCASLCLWTYDGGNRRHLEETPEAQVRHAVYITKFSLCNRPAVPLANLNVKLSFPVGGSLDYEKNSLANVTELYTKGFNLTIPPNTHEASNKAGTWRAGSQGWWVFLKPLSPGDHTIFYNIRVTPTGLLTSPGTNPHFADFTYSLHVRK
jgi:hypothetical protein